MIIPDTSSALYKRMSEQLEGVAYTDFELIKNLIQWGFEHSKECPGCCLEGILYSAANRITELSQELPKDMMALKATYLSEENK